MSIANPYEYHNEKLGVKMKFLINDRNFHPQSLQLISYRTLKARLLSGKRPETQLRKGTYYTDALVEFETLPAEWKRQIIETFGEPVQKIKKSFFAQHYKYDIQAYNFFTAYRYGKNGDKKLSAALIEQYTADASVINTIIDVKKRRKAYASSLGITRLDIWQTLSNDVNAFREVAHNLPPNKDALRKKVSQYIKKGYEALISRKLQNQNAAKIKERKQKALIDELIAKHNNLDYQVIADIYNAVAKQLGYKPIDRQTVANRAKTKKLITYAGRNGLNELENNVLMQVKRSRPSAPMLYWTADGWDVELLYQATNTNKKGYEVTTYTNRLTMVAVLDPYNNYPVGYAIGTHETPELIKRAFQNAMQHVRSLFGDFYMPYQLQTDNYGGKELKDLYRAITPHYTPARVKNAKSKVIEPYFAYINKKYCKLLPNWSGFGVASGSKSQPNEEYLNKIKKQFPDQIENIKQIERIIETERAAKQDEYIKGFANLTKSEHKQVLSEEAYLRLFGMTTGYTNKLRGEGIVATIEGHEYTFDSFDLAFRQAPVDDWRLYYDSQDLSKVLAVSTDGQYRFILQQKYVQPMALADRQAGDIEQLTMINRFNKKAKEKIIQERAENAEILQDFFQLPALQDTLAKHLLTDSLGQHKNQKSQARLQMAKQLQKTNKKQQKQAEKTAVEAQNEYYEQKININEFINP